MSTIDGVHESFEGDVQYPFADVGAKELMHISFITEDNRKSFTYTCPYCKKQLRPRLGTKKTHHFAHNPGENCDKDRYIHTTAEKLIKEKWDRDEPFEIIMNIRKECERIDNCIFYTEYGCCKSVERKTFNLKEHYTQCILEKKYGEFIPDLCLIDDTGKHEPIFIEIWSKHKNSEKKANSNHMIIEIRLKTIQELEELPKQPITESSTITFSHFKTLKKSPTKEDSPGLMRYILYADTFKSYIDEQSVFCNNFSRQSHKSKSIFEVVGSREEISSGVFRKVCNAIAIDRGYDIRSCYLCQLYGQDERYKRYDDNFYINLNSTVGCQRELDVRGLIECKPEDALTCKEFKLKDSLSRLKARYTNISRYIWYKNADGSEKEEFQKRKDYSDYHEFDEI